MKVKKLFLSMCTIVALASCSQNEDVPAPESNALPAKVTVHFTGSGTETRAIGEGDAIVNRLVAFFFTSDGVRTGDVIFVDDPTNATVQTFMTTTSARQVVLVANSNLTRLELQNVGTLNELKQKVETSYSGNNALQVDGDLTMSGYGTVLMNSDGAGTANVTLHYLTAKLRSIKVLFNDVNSGQYEDVPGKLNADSPGGKWFSLNAAYLMMVQTSSPFLPAANLTAWTGGFVPSTFTYAGGMGWGVKPWPAAPAETNPAVVTGYKLTTVPASENIVVDDKTFKGVNFYSTSIVQEEKRNKTWYLFENASDHLTGLVLDFHCLVSKGDTYTKQSRYFTIYFGESGVNGTSSQPKIEAGKQYDITLKINKSFDASSGSGGGGGTTDPSVPSVEANIAVTITPAQWDASPVVMNKDF